MITARFIGKVHYYFDELGYHVKKKISYNSFYKTVLKTIAHCQDIGDVKMTLFMAKYCRQHWSKIEKMFEKRLELFNCLDYEGNKNLTILSDEDSEGKYYVSNGLGSSLGDVLVISQSIEDYYLYFAYEKRRFVIFSDGNYYLKFTAGSSPKMKLFNNNGECLCDIVLSNNCQIFLTNNKTRYKLAAYDDFIGIYDRHYKYTNTKEDFNHLVADIDWDTIEQKSNAGIAQLNVYELNQDLEMLLFFAASTFLVFNKYIKEVESRERWSTVRTIATMGIISNHFKH